MLKLHQWKLLALGLAANILLSANFALGDTKRWNVINWLDVISEGGAALLALVWLLLILQSRPAGRVTQWLSLGLSCIFLAGFQDWLDEFITFPDAALWDHWVESGLMPIGLGLLTLGIYHWHQEQIAINEQLRKRERLFREHRGLDFITQLNGATYLRKQLQQELSTHYHSHSSLALVFIDIDYFDDTNRRYGHQEGDRFLQALGEFILLNIRGTDLLCRYAGDRFALVLPNTGRIMAEALSAEITRALHHFAFKSRTQGESIFHTASIGIALTDSHRQDTADSLIERATIALLHAKEKRKSTLDKVA
ncbi:GGDEF domain-containing protein [Cellvibrio mixtus]|uniref:GGDEF domain-containing protein n=1 Tax=Cellvibrio mixtus TaxID=39650 RepID=UPI000586DBFD|nr:diguanylate cyclase [Cellvibrio mixtus]